MILLLVGALFIALGLFAGAVLVAVPLGWVPWSADVVLWLVFPVFSVGGYLFFITGARVNRIRGPSILVASLLLVLAAVSATGLVLQAASIVEPAGNTWSLWYVLAVAGILGSIGAASYSKSDQAI